MGLGRGVPITRYWCGPRIRSHTDENACMTHGLSVARTCKATTNPLVGVLVSAVHIVAYSKLDIPVDPDSKDCPSCSLYAHECIEYIARASFLLVFLRMRPARSRPCRALAVPTNARRPN